MKIRHLGTAAAERIPGLFCRCAICRHALEHGGKEIRTQSQALIDENVMLDYPGDGYMHALQHRIDMPAVHSLLVTHWHSDHYYGEDIAYRMNPYALGDIGCLMVYGSATVQEFYERAFFLEQKHEYERVCFEVVRPGDRFDLGDGHWAMAFEARHGHEFGDCLFYAVGDGERTVLYAHDTGYFYDRTWNMLAGSGVHFDYVSLDCNHALHGISLNSHMNFEDNIAVRERMLDMGLADRDTVFVANHFSHNGGTTHEEMARAACERGFVVAYDGMAGSSDRCNT